VQQKNGPRYRELGLDGKARSRAERAIARILTGGNALTRRELQEALGKSRIDLEGQRFPFMLSHCELEAVICSGPPNGKQQTFALLDDRVPPGASVSPDRATTELIGRYLGSHGPSTIKDMTWWSGLKATDLRRALEEMGGEVQNEEVEGLTLWMTNAPRPSSSDDRSIHLLQAYDELIVGYSESRYIGDPRAVAARAAFKDRSMPTGVVLSGVHVIGHWRRSIKERSAEVEVLLYEEQSAATLKRLDVAVRAFGAFLGREVGIRTGLLSG
jgi:hypothetical protein